jgi:hypothetical protein
MPVFEPQRPYEARFAFSPNKEGSYGTVLADGKFTRSTPPLAFDAPQIVKTFLDDADKSWKGGEWPTQRRQTRQNVVYPLNFELSALVAGHIAAFCLGKVTSTKKATGPPDAWEHVIIFQDPVTISHHLPSTGHWFKMAEDLGIKSKGAVCTGFSVSYTRGQPVLQINSNWVGSGDYVNADLASIPALDTVAALGYLFEGGLDILWGTPGAEASIADRVQAFSIEISNGAQEDTAYYPGTNLYKGRFLIGKRAVTLKFTLFAKDPDDLMALFTGDTEQGFKVVVTGDTITGSEHHKLTIYTPAVRVTEPKWIDAGGYVAWDMAPQVLKPGAAEIVTVTVENVETAYLGT